MMPHLSDKHMAVVQEILAREVPGKIFAIFGSRAGGAVKPYSDLDLFCESPLSTGERARLVMAFDESDLPFRVDILDSSDMDESALGHRIRIPA